ncbi:hypothetical protein METBIDRAFT_31142 [Metschnikowia bicuspidata var. bicuspidata NRRL YB-4993]|uniref:BHLH domain-containing protein n=1 Tax=Metschnikowia bicuspidata var. bicuspidata NRRL YB-4993 TaxID=869754 RepID=A0A1A0HDY8_9ASCO|nr:hypothetical protein METBIDRAFT_31142 [Metschnikowia bicuspidata var. bicuspidata NRRL YB-4993]OBA22195.1 hypothetical protein METBIDRAFT_31142 [Metschnikowia bicuspidata var. bicuspidata NRRL YB-4993]
MVQSNQSVNHFDSSEIARGQLKNSTKSFHPRVSSYITFQTNSNTPPNLNPENSELEMTKYQNLPLGLFSKVNAGLPPKLNNFQEEVLDLSSDFNSQQNIRDGLLSSLALYTGSANKESTSFSTSSTSTQQNKIKGSFEKRRIEVANTEHTNMPDCEDPRTTIDSLGHASEAPANKVKLKSSHNVIEQRYRNKINDKFTALQHSVPTLRAAVEKKDKLKVDEGIKGSELEEVSDLSDSSTSLEGLQPATKLNKGTILAKTVEYIKFLEGKNKSLTMEYEQILTRARMLGLRYDENSDYIEKEG